MAPQRLKDAQPLLVMRIIPFQGKVHDRQAVGVHAQKGQSRVQVIRHIHQ